MESAPRAAGEKILRLKKLGVVTIAVVSLSGGTAFAACGDKGGPGYRAANGKCVGWDALARSCGDPPTLRCTPERAQPEAIEAAQQGSRIKQFMDTAHDRVKGVEK